MDFCLSLTWNLVYKAYLTTGISLLGALVNTFFICTFIKFLRNAAATSSQSGPKSQVHKYLLVKSINDDLQFILLLFSLLYYEERMQVNESYWMQVWYKWLYRYLEAVCEMSSGLLTITAALDVLLTILNRCEIFRKTCFFCAATLGAYLFAFSFNTYQIFRYQITSSQNETGFEILETEFVNTQLFSGLEIANGIFRDGLVIVVLTVENVLILHNFRRSMSNKKKLAFFSVTTLLKMKNSLTNRAKKSKPNNPKAQVAEELTEVTSTSNAKSKRPRLATVIAAKSAAVSKSERKTTLMIVVNGAIYIFGHLLGFVQACSLVPSTQPVSCMLGDIGKVMYYSTCIFPLLLFIRSNKVLWELGKSSLFACCPMRARKQS